MLDAACYSLTLHVVNMMTIIGSEMECV